MNVFIAFREYVIKIEKKCISVCYNKMYEEYKVNRETL